MEMLTEPAACLPGEAIAAPSASIPDSTCESSEESGAMRSTAAVRESAPISHWSWEQL